MDDPKKVEAWKALEEARAKFDLAEAEDRDPTAEEEAFVDAALKAVEEAEREAANVERKNKLKAIEDQYHRQAEANEEVKREAAKGILVPEVKVDDKKHGTDSPEYLKAFTSYVRGDARDEVKDYLRRESKTDGAEGATGTGGYLVPEFIWNTLWTDTTAGYPLLNLVTTYNISGYKVLIDQAFSHGTAAIVSEAGTPAAADETYTQVEIQAYKLQTLSKVSDELIDDAMFDVVAHLTGVYARIHAEAENLFLTTGSGTSQPQGIVTGVYATSGQRVSGASGETGTISADEVFTTLHKTAPQYRARGMWFVNDDTIRVLRTLKDADGNYLWVQGLQADVPNRLVGYPVVSNPNMATMTASAKSVLFADPTGEVRVVPNNGNITILRLNERYADTGQVGFRATRRFGGGFVGVTTSGSIFVNAAS